jgi:gliding motility-associated-like protein
LKVDSADLGYYNVTVKDIESGCIKIAQLKVRNGTFKANVEASLLSGFAPLTVSFSNLSGSTLGSKFNNDNVNTIWNFGNGSYTVTKAANISPTAVYNQPGTYTVNAFAKKGTCLDSVTKLYIKVNVPSRFEVPNVFTPNNDGINDFFFLHTASLNDISASIYDRWGRLVFKTEHSTTGNISWDGKTPEGKDAPTGTYFYVIKADGSDGKAYEEKGTLSLIR